MDFPAVIFDFDGVIMDTEPLHYAAFRELWEPIGFHCSWEQYQETFIGFDDRDALRTAARLHGEPEPDGDELDRLIAHKADVFERLMQRENPPLYGGVAELIQWLKQSGRALGLCSGALRRDLQPALEQHALIEAFDAIVTADEVGQSKPAPECYELTLRRLQHQRHDSDLSAPGTLAIEDTPAGIAAARSAGMAVLAVTNTHGSAELHEAQWLTDSLSQFHNAVQSRGLQQALTDCASV